MYTGHVAILAVGPDMKSRTRSLVGGEIVISKHVILWFQIALLRFMFVLKSDINDMHKISESNDTGPNRCILSVVHPNTK
jgi:hypothetical protein